ncbi:glycosyltransferase family 2 protein [Pseudoruegeria sp. HB172150]|uniref:glycosyltransferase family 2 protein n=1 Tax=Pseudoruegeria sp. HB172150 TaxID=2721164 RepID=UPI0015542B3B|nr:glycosyltransferase family 2 protein [Pseudoruegeria sp. HB172150]
MPRISIIVPFFNAVHTLAATVLSLRSQTFEDWECLLVDDGSTDGSRALAAMLLSRDARIRLLRNPGKGPSAARNFGVSQAQGDIIAFCDADDLWMPSKLAEIDTAIRGGADATYGAIAFFDGQRARTQSTVPPEPLTIAMLLGENPVCTMSNLAVRRDAFLSTGGFDETLVHNEDLEWLIRLTGQGASVTGIDKLLVSYRTSPTGLSSDLSAMRKGREAALATAARFGHQPDARAEAIHLRYLSRRALRVDAPRAEALRLALSGLATSPRGFLSDLRRGGLTLTGALVAPLLPRQFRRRLFAA